MEAKVEAVQKNETSNRKGLLLPEHKRLKNFIIPKRIPDKDLLTECSTNQRDYSDVKQQLNQSCLDTECNLESLWHFDKIEMVHNKDLEEEFVAKRAKLREEGRQDKELSNFLVVSKDEVSKICQSGLRTSSSTKKELSIMKELGNPQLGVYLFRYVDIALNYASKYSIPIENIIIFRVLLGKVKKIQPSKGKKKVALDPTPNFDCHMSRIHPSLKDSMEDQYIGSLVYFYEYSELSKPVDKPRQCLPYAVIKVKCVNPKVVVEYPIAFSKCRPKRLPKHEGRGRGLPLENCTRVTRIGKNKLIYEHFRKPEESYSVNLENNACTEVSSFSESKQIWNDSVVETQCRKMKHKLSRWDSVTVETNQLNLQHTSDMNACRNVRSYHMGEANQNPLKVHPGVSSVCDSCSSTVITSRLIKDPRLTKREQNLGKQNGKAVFHGILQCKNQLECNSKVPTTLGLPYPVPEEFFLLNSSKCALSHRQFMEKMSWKERTLEEYISPSLLYKSKDYSVNGETGLGNKEILASQNTHVDHTLKTNVSHDFLKSEDYGNKSSNGTSAGDLKRKGMKHSKLFSSLLHPSTSVSNEWKTQEIEPVCITVHNKKQERILELPFYDCTNISICNQNPESVTPCKNVMDNRGKMTSRLQINDICNSEIQCATDYDTSCAKNNCSSLEREFNSDGETGSVQDHNLESEFHRKNCLSECMLKEAWTEDICERSLGDQMSEDNCEQNKTRAILQHEKPSMTDSSKQTIQILSATENTAEKPGREENSASEDLEKSAGDIKKLVETSDNSDVLDLESSSSDFCLNFQEMCLLTETPLMKIENDKEQLRDIHDQTLLSKCTSLTAHQKKNNTAFLFIDFVPVPLGKVKQTEIKKPESENICPSETSFVPKISEQDLKAISKDITIPDLKFPSEIEIVSEASKKCSSVPQKSDSHGNVSEELATYLYLQERMDWESLFEKPSLNMLALGSPLREDNESESLDERKTGVEEETELFNTSVWPGLQITVTSIFQPKLDPHSNSLRIKSEIEKCAAKYSGQKKGRKWSPKKKMKKYTLNQKNSKLCHKKKKLKIYCSSEVVSLSKERFKTFAQSEKHIKNVLNTLNTEALLCKNKYLSQKIDGAVFHLRKAQRSVQKSLKIVAKARKKRLSDSSKSYEVLHNDFLERCDPAVYDGSSVISGCISDVPCCSDNVTTTNTVGQVTVSEKSTSLDIEDIKTINDEHIMNHDQKIYVNVTSGNNSQENVTTAGNTKQVFKMLENGFSDEKEIMEIPSIQQENMSVCVGRCIASSDTLLSPGENKHDVRAVQLIPQIHEVEQLCLKTKLDTLSKRNSERYCSDKLTEYFTGQKQDAGVYGKKNILQSEYCSSNNEIVEQKLYTAENEEYKPVALTVKQLENNADTLLSSDYQLSPMPLDDDKTKSSQNYVLQEPIGEEEEIGISTTKRDFLGLEPYVIRDIPVKPSVEVALEQKDIIPSKESTCRQISSTNTNKVVRLQSPLRMVSEQDIGSFTATNILPHVLPNKTNQNVTNAGSRLNEKCLSNEYPFDPEDMHLTKAGVELTSLDFISKISEILQKADETSSSTLLHKQIIVCRNVLPTFIRAFEKKQGCSFERVLVSREIIENAERSIWTGDKLKPCAIESLIELQIIMETIEYIENKKRLLEGELTFRSLLWYDDSLCSELFGGRSGYQQQSNFYPAFQRRLKYSAVSELQSYHKQLVEVFENTRWQNHSYYSFLKSRREIEECEAAFKSSSHFSDFFLSVPYVCGANYGDTVEDLQNARKSTVDLINVCKSLPGITFSAEKEDHLWIIMEIIATKIDFIKTCEEVNLKASLFGLEHIFFDAAKSLAWGESVKLINEGEKGAKEQSLQINEVALSKFYEIYEHMVGKLGSGNSCIAPEENVPKNFSEELYCENRCGQQETNYYIRNSLDLHLDIGYISKILDEAQSANVNELQQLMCRCTEHLEILKKYFQILQEENVSNVLITKENVLGYMKNGGINAVVLKPEAVEVYTEMAMIYETVSFLKNSIARKVDKPRFRSLLWFDESLLPELFRCQEKIASFSYRKDNFLKMIESSISELKDELNVVCDYAEKLNCSYAVHLLTRELKELSETRNLLQTSKTSISMCVDFVPYTISLNYGSTVSELDCNYNQFSLLLEKLMLADTKDLGKMAHIMKIMKTIEHMKFVCTEQGKSPLPVVIYQMLKNWRKSCQLKRQDLNTPLDTNKRHSTKHGIYVSDPQVLNSAAVGSQAQQKRPASVTSKDNSCTYEEDDSSHSKKKKTHEEETSRNPRKSAKYNFLKEKEFHLNISTGNTWNTKVDYLKEGSPISPSYSKDLKVAYPLEHIQCSPNTSESEFVHSSSLQNLADLKGFNKSSRNCSQNVKQYNQKCFTSYDERSKDASVSSTKLQLPQGFAGDSATSVAKLGGSTFVPTPLNEHCSLKPNSPRDTSGLIPDCSRAISLTSEHDETKRESKNIYVTRSYAPAYSGSSAVTELNEMEPLCTEPSSNENIKNSSAFCQNDKVEEIPQMQNSVHTYRTVYPYSWYFCQTGSSSHSVTQTYQEVNSYETYNLSSGMFTTTSTVYNAQSSMFYSQTLSQFGVEESQRYNFVQTYPVCDYFSSSMPFLCSYQQPPSWYSQAAFPYPNIGM